MDTQTRRRYNDQHDEPFARMLKALANGQRLELLELLAQREHSVEELARERGLSVANTAQHLQTLHAAQLVELRRVGTFVRYRLADEQVFRVWSAIRDLGAPRLPEIDRLVNETLQTQQALAPVERTEFVQRLQESAAVLLDVCPVEEYRAGHIPGAWSMPLAGLDAGMAEVPQDQEIMTCCRGPSGPLADAAAARLPRETTTVETHTGVSDHDHQ